MRRHVRAGETVYLFDDRSGERDKLYRTISTEEEIQEVVAMLKHSYRR